jgi:signal transduction histidine kinase
LTEVNSRTSPFAAGTHHQSLINEILDLSKSEAGKLELNPEPVNLTRLIDEVISTAGQWPRRASLVVEAEEKLGALNANPMRLKQILHNLLSNACKFTKDGEIALRLRKVADGRERVELAVVDSGIGMTADSRRNCFRISPRPIPSPRAAMAGARPCAAAQARAHDGRRRDCD